MEIVWPPARTRAGKLLLFSLLSPLLCLLPAFRYLPCPAPICSSSFEYFLAPLILGRVYLNIPSSSRRRLSLSAEAPPSSQDPLVIPNVGELFLSYAIGWTLGCTLALAAPAFAWFACLPPASFPVSSSFLCIFSRNKGELWIINKQWTIYSASMD